MDIHRHSPPLKTSVRSHVSSPRFVPAWPVNLLPATHSKQHSNVEQTYRRTNDVRFLCVADYRSTFPLLFIFRFYYLSPAFCTYYFLRLVTTWRVLIHYVLSSKTFNFSPRARRKFQEVRKLRTPEYLSPRNRGND